MGIDRVGGWICAGLAALAACAYLALTAAEYLRAVGLRTIRDEVQRRRKRRIQRLEKLGYKVPPIDELAGLSPDEIARRVRAKVLESPAPGQVKPAG